MPGVIEKIIFMGKQIISICFVGFDIILQKKLWDKKQTKPDFLFPVTYITT